LWTLLLGAFARLLEYNSPSPPATMIDARLVELPPAPGLQGSGAPAASPAPRPVAKPKPLPRPVRKRAPAIHHRIEHRSLERRLSPHPAPHHESASSAPEPAPAAPSTAGGNSAAPAAKSGGVSGETGTGAGGGVGGDAGGARAIYAPMPKIPDDLREDPLTTVAIAAFKVDVDGSAQVTLVKPTSIPRLNYLLLSTLKQWRFFPAVKNGQPVASQFEIRIPITIQ
jgi:protein TonB